MDFFTMDWELKQLKCIIAFDNCTQTVRYCHAKCSHVTDFNQSHAWIFTVNEDWILINVKFQQWRDNDADISSVSPWHWWRPIAQNTFSMVSNKTPARPNLWLAIKAQPLCHPYFLHNQAIYQPSGYLDPLKLVIKLWQGCILSGMWDHTIQSNPRNIIRFQKWAKHYILGGEKLWKLWLNCKAFLMTIALISIIIIIILLSHLFSKTIEKSCSLIEQL